MIAFCNILMLLCFLLSIVLFFVAIILFVVKLIKRQKKKPAFVCLLFSIIMMIISFSLALSPLTGDLDTTDSGVTTTREEVTTTRELEVMTAKYCMTYMDYLKNPYSFKVKYAWAHANTAEHKKGTYSVYVKFTAENSYGGTIADTISYSAVDDELLKNFYPEIHVWTDEPSEKVLGYGQVLDVKAVQDYIDENYPLR